MHFPFLLNNRIVKKWESLHKVLTVNVITGYLLSHQGTAPNPKISLSLILTGQYCLGIPSQNH